MDSTIKKSSECKKSKAWKKVLTKVLGLTNTELLESLVEKELAHKKHD